MGQAGSAPGQRSQRSTHGAPCARSPVSSHTRTPTSPSPPTSAQHQAPGTCMHCPAQPGARARSGFLRELPSPQNSPRHACCAEKSAAHAAVPPKTTSSGLGRPTHRPARCFRNLTPPCSTPLRFSHLSGVTCRSDCMSGFTSAARGSRESTAPSNACSKPFGTAHWDGCRLQARCCHQLRALAQPSCSSLTATVASHATGRASESMYAAQKSGGSGPAHASKACSTSGRLWSILSSNASMLCCSSRCCCRFMGPRAP